VGLCSYLLIGFWSDDPANGAAARKAFIVTRVGDTAMAIGLFLLFTQLGTLDIQTMMQRATHQWPAGSGLAVAAAALLLIGALGKSAQLPLQTWLPDAMAGPTPVSALIHAATMVTAGVYLIARTNVLFTLAPVVQSLVAIIGSVTLLVAGCSALVQTDIKRVLAYSTISQIGYMFLALGVGAWQAAMFHFMTHAFFKALLFLGAGAVIISLHHEQNMLKMGGLRRQLPVTFWTFLIGACSLSALPFVTAGYYSKDMILHEAWTSGPAGLFPWMAGVAGAFLTGLYTFRMVFIVWFGSEYRLQPGVSSEYRLQPGVSSEYRLQPGVSSEYRPQPGVSSEYRPQPGVSSEYRPQPGVSSEYRLQPGVSSEYRLQPGVPTKLKTEVIRAPGWAIHIPLILLAILSIAGGFIEIPAILGQAGRIGQIGLIGPIGPIGPIESEWVFQITALGFPLLGIGLAYTLYMRPRRLAQARRQRPILDGIRRWWFVGWGFDWLYDRLFVMPFLRFARANRDDAADLIYQGIAWLNVALHHALRATQSGQVRWYAAGIALGAAIILGIVVITT